jgi:hypothetical protein
MFSMTSVGTEAGTTAGSRAAVTARMVALKGKIRVSTKIVASTTD